MKPASDNPLRIAILGCGMMGQGALDAMYRISKLHYFVLDTLPARC
jgi:hypothetical protein